jgi:hypothetical protein
MGLVGCVGKKQSRSAPARDLYTSTLFRGRRRWVERSCERWFILSALHGLIKPSMWLEPYDVSLTEVGVDDRRRWSTNVLRQVDEALGDVAGVIFEVHAGGAYREHGLVEGLLRRRALVEVPMAGLSIGRQLAAYADRDVPDDRRKIVKGLTPPDAEPSSEQPRRSRANRAHYGGLREFLVAHGQHHVIATFSEVEKLLGCPLPASARRHRAWWANSSANSQARAWLEVGWSVSHLDLNGARVTFDRTPTHGR